MQTISGATIRLYYYETQSVQTGCFSLGGADALPFEFSVSAPGYKPVTIKAVPGSYQAAITLIPETSAGSSTSTLHEISQEQYNALSQGCPSEK